MAGLLSATSLPQFLRETAKLPFTWGDCDCFMWPCSWWLVRHGIDPAHDLRNTYNNKLGAYKRIVQEGGPIPMAKRLAAQAGMKETSEPVPGDMILAMTDPKRPMFGYSLGIYVGMRTAFKAPSGLTTLIIKPVIAWSS